VSVVNKSATFFKSLLGDGDKYRDISLVMVGHFTSDNIVYWKQLREVFNIPLVISKKASSDEDKKHILEEHSTYISADRQLFSDATYVKTLLNEHVKTNSIVFIDVGGYFPVIASGDAYVEGKQILGIVEDTENGFQRYQELQNLTCPVYSVARSPLKEPEDFLVGQSVVLALELLLKKHGMHLSAKKCTVFGYGKIGRSVANGLSSRLLSVSVVETNPIIATQAMSMGLHVSNRENALRLSDIVFSCTGNKNLNTKDLHSLKNNALVVSVTSVDDEFDFENLINEFTEVHRDEGICLYESNITSKRFYLVNEGNAMNFFFKDYTANVGMFIRLIQAEIIAAIKELVMGCELGLHEVEDIERKNIASNWLSVFNDEY